MPMFEIGGVFNPPSVEPKLRQFLRYLGEEGGEHWFIRTDQKYPWPEAFSADDLFKPGWTEQTDPWIALRATDDDALSEFKKDVRKRCNEIVDAVLEAARSQATAGQRPASLLLKSSNRNTLFAAVETKLGKANITISRAIRRWWVRGMMPNASLPDTDAMAGKGSCRAISAAVCDRSGWPLDPGIHDRIGRESKNGNNGIRMTIPIRNRIITRGAELYLKNKAYSIRLTYIAWKQEERAQGMIDSRLPTQPAFDKILSAVPAVAEEKRKRSLYGAPKKQKPANAESTSTRVSGPGFCMQIDSTPPPMHIREEGTKRIYEDVVVYFTTDCHSKGIWGRHVAIGSAAASIAGEVLVSSIDEKPPQLKKNGITRDKAAWPMCGRPEQLVADRGELMGPIADIIVDVLKVTMSNTVAYSPQLKADVERAFREMMQILITQLDDYVAPRAGRVWSACGNHPVLTLREFRVLLDLFILAYNSRILDRLPSPAQAEAKTPMTPNGIWNGDYDKIKGAAQKLSSDEIIIICCKVGAATIDRSGIWFERLLYKCDAPGVKEFRDRIGDRSRRVKVRYSEDSTNTLRIQVRELARVGVKTAIELHRFVECDLHVDARKWADYTFPRYLEMISKYGNEVTQEARHKHDQTLGHLTEGIKEQNDTPKPHADQSPGAAKEIKASIKAAESDERLVTNHANGATQSAGDSPIPTVAKPDAPARPKIGTQNTLRALRRQGN